MKKLLERYRATQMHFRQESVRESYSSIQEWSKAFNYALSEIMDEMSAEELSIVLKETTGYMRTVIKEYIDKAVKKEQEQLLCADYVSFDLEAFSFKPIYELAKSA